MNVLLSAFACKPGVGTEPGFGWNYALYLALRGLNIYVLTAAHNEERVEAYLADNPTPRVHFSYVNVPFIRTGNTHGLRYILWQWAALAEARKLAATGVKFDIAHHVTYGSVHVPSQLWRLGVPLVFGPVGGGQTAPPQLLGYFGKARRQEQLRTILTRAIKVSPLHRYWMKHIDLVLATNRETYQLARTLGVKNALAMCDTALPDDFFAEEPRTFSADYAAPLRLLWVATMLPRKGLPLALDALAHTRSPVTLTIAGNGLAVEEVQKLIADRKLEGRVFWAGRRLEYSEVREAYLTHDALLFTSLRESFGAQLVEAMGLGLPTLCFDMSGARQFVPDKAGIRVPVGTRDQTVAWLAEAIDHFASLSAEQRNAMSAAGLEFARTLSYSARAAVFENLYRQLQAGVTPAAR